ncbi:alpha-2-macroglobulin family protein [Tenacibaculum tangerinum]|uniref:alpha-2-macroglobulin family protein n=1 Tax=Tenacibaculum tangerinum TaxID=3038772 RepID=UPI002ADE3059|nr:MG2 domain-containing protein [Tenacibaculum tangerinum]
MKKTTPILLMILFSSLTYAQENYNNLWEKVRQLESENLTKSALQVVNTIYTKAEKSNNAPQIIKSLLYKSKYSLILEEDAQLQIIHNFKQHINKSDFPSKNILESMLANLYWQYFNQNRWKFYDRTKTQQKVAVDDFRTWDLNTLFTEIHKHYQQSLENELQLKATNVRTFKDIIYTEVDSEKYRPTLFDFLAHNALEFYETPETNITKPNYQFKINDTSYLTSAKNFSTLNLNTKDETSLQFNALKIYQKLISFHIKNNHLKALTDVDIQRLQFVNKHATFNNKEEVLLQTLKTSVSNLKNNEVSGLYRYEIASVYLKQANLYTAEKNEDFRFKNKEALAICNKIMEQFPKSFAAEKANILQQQITATSLSIVSEKIVPIQAHSRLLITYNNIDKLYFSAYKIDHKQLEELQNMYREVNRFNFIKKLTKVTSWNSSLRNENDYLPHTTEVVVPKLPQGNYILVAHQNPTFNSTSLYGTTSVQVTNLTLIENDSKGVKTYQVLDRNTGEPIKNAELLLQNKKHRYGQSIRKKLTTDENGFAYFKSNTSYSNVYVTVTTKNDAAVFGNYYLNKYQKPATKTANNEYTSIKPFVFTDRSIYRPGQTVYFKTIFIQKQGEKTIPFTNEPVQITLHDVNGEAVKTLDIQLNEYGSGSGEIIIPNTGLTGEYWFSIDESETQESKFYDSVDFDFEREEYIARISVEEYKRPKFKTEFNPITKTYKLNDSITINGLAKAYAGSTITNAKVVYRVYRKVKYPIWWYWRRPQFTSEAQEITHGELFTDTQGNFSITFKALPDESVNRENLPVFEYEVSADVTDVNGETRSATTVVKVGYHALLANIQIPSTIQKSEKETTIKISSNNLNGEFVGAKGVVKIHKLQAPKNPLRKRPWETPDYQDISETEFRKLFPHDAYTSEEENTENWKKGALVFEQHFDTQKSKEIVLDNYKKWISGKYLITLESEDQFGQKVTDKALFTVSDITEKKVVDKQLFSYKTNKTSYKPNDIVELHVGSASKDMTIVLQVEKNYTILNTKLIHVSNNLKTIKIPVTKEDVGGFVVKYYFVKYNSFVSGTIPISVANEQETIAIETHTFRDKLQPGTQETWSFTIKNDHSNKVTAEVLASMYDVSLDEFKPNHWEFTPIETLTYSPYGSSANAYQSFGNEHFRISNTAHPSSFRTQRYDQLNWFGFYFGRNRNMYPKALAMSTRIAPSPEREIAVEEEATLGAPANLLDEMVVTAYGVQKAEEEKEEKVSLDGVQIRKNLQETAFFYPHLQTDENGNVTFSFTTPEALTRWKLQLLAHTKELQSASKTLTTVTQKELMVIPNAPRFLREGDQITFSTKIANIADKNLQGTAQLTLTDAITGEEINLLNNSSKNQSFSVDANGNTNVSWHLSIPDSYQAIQYKIVAKAGAFSDGEQNVLPVLSNRMLVTETLPLWVRSNQSKTFTLDKLKNQTSTTLNHHKLTLEVTSNPAWYAVQALPYLMEYPYECSEQTFARYYANALASHIVNSNPRIQEVFNTWKSSDALLSNLEKNQELKSLLIQETPWLRDAQSETEQKKRIALLFDMNTMQNAQQNTMNKLLQMQLNNGGFPWFKGNDYPNIYITNHIATGFGHLQKLGITFNTEATTALIKKSVHFLDAEIEDMYKRLLKNAERIKAEKGQKEYTKYLEKNHLNYFIIQYLYMRSFYNHIDISSSFKTAVAYYKNQTTTYWKEFNLYGKGQIALQQFRSGNTAVATKILNSLRENSITSDELGMYWKENQPSWYWHQAPIETQSLLIEAFSEIENDTKTVDNLKIWLLKNKQTNRWKTTKATTEAVYALLLQGSDWISVTDMVAVTVGTKTISPTKLENTKIEAGTGYFKTSWSGAEITSDMSTVNITKKGKGIAWGGLYWQYFEDLDKITSAKTPLQLSKKLFKKVNTHTGKELQELTENTPLKVGDLLTVRIELRL